MRGNGASRDRVLGAVHELMRTAGNQCRFVLTARPYAWPGGPEPARGVYALADLNDEQIEQFIRAWYAALVKRRWRSPGEAERKLDDLLDARHRPDLLPLARLFFHLASDSSRSPGENSQKREHSPSHPLDTLTMSGSMRPARRFTSGVSTAT